MSSGRVNPSGQPSLLAGNHSTNSWVPPAASARTSTSCPTRPPLAANGNCRNASRVTVMWSAAVFEPAAARPQQQRQRFADAPRAVVDERAQRMETEANLERRRRVLLLRVRVEQSGVQVNDQRIARVDVVVRGMVTGQFPGRRPCSGTGGGDRRRTPPPTRRRRQRPFQTGLAHGFDQQRRTRLRHDPRSGGVDGQRRIEPGRLAHRKVLLNSHRHGRGKPCSCSSCATNVEGGVKVEASGSGADQYEHHMGQGRAETSDSPST